MNNEIQFILYQLPDKEGKVQVVIKDETIWATQKAMSQLFDIDKSGISHHVSNIFKEGELRQETTVAKIATVVNRGIRGEVEEPIDFYNLDMIIAVGYRVSSARATKFRQWATKILNEYIRKGFVLDEDRLKQMPIPQVSLLRSFFVGSSIPLSPFYSSIGLLTTKSMLNYE